MGKREGERREGEREDPTMQQALSMQPAENQEPPPTADRSSRNNFPSCHWWLWWSELAGSGGKVPWECPLMAFPPLCVHFHSGT